MINSDRLEALAEQFYSAACLPDLLRPALQAATEALGADGACVFSFPDSIIGGSVWSEGIDELADWIFNEGGHLSNPRPLRALRLQKFKAVVTESDLFTPWELERLPFNAKMCGRLGFRWDVGTLVGKIGNNHVLFTTQRRKHRERFESAETEAIGALAPHLKRAVRMADAITSAHAAGMLDTLEEMACAAILVDGSGSICRLNQKAEKIIGKGIEVTQRKLAATDRAADADFQRFMADVLAPIKVKRDRPRVVAVLPRESGYPLVAYAMPLGVEHSTLFHRAKAIIAIIDPDERKHPPEAVLRRVFELTPAESRLALGLAAGNDIREIAEACCISIGTARVQLKSIMAKTETGRQAELVALLAQLGLFPKSGS